MKLLLKSQVKKLQANWKASIKLEAEGKESNHKVVVKLFNPTGIGAWYITEQKPEDPNILYGLCVLHEAEWGYVSLAELKAFKGRDIPIGIERDMYYKGITTQELQKRVDDGEDLG